MDYGAYERMMALLDIERAKTPDGRLMACQAALEAGHIDRPAFLRLADAPADRVSGILAELVGFGAAHYFGESAAVAPTSRAEAQATARRRAGQTLVGAYQSLVIPGVPDCYNAGRVARFREAIGDLTAALDRWVDLHTPCGCAENNARAATAEGARAGLSYRQACSRCPDTSSAGAEVRST